MSGTRLVGAGRLCVEVPAEWPTVSQGPVEQSCIEYASMVEPAVAYGPPAPGTVCVAPEHAPGCAWRGAAADRVRGARGTLTTEERGADGRVTIWVDAPDLEASIRLTGDLELARSVAATARPVPPGSVTVPNLFLGVTPLSPLAAIVQPNADQARLQLRWAGLVPVLEPPEGATDGDVDSCDPLPFSVVPDGSEVCVVLARADEPWRDDTR